MVEGKIKRDFSRNLTRGAVSKGSAVATGALIGSVVPGIGNVIGGALGLAASALMKDDVDKVADTVESSVFEKVEYEFCCPKCGRTWSNTQKNQTYSQNKKNIESNVDKAVKIVQDNGSKVMKSFKDSLKKIKW